VPWYEHHEAGFNYRLSNLLAAVGRGQLQRLPHMIERRAHIEQRYRNHFAARPGIGFIPHPPEATSNHWLTVITLDPAITGATPEQLRMALDGRDIEARQAWKPMHLQPLFADARMRGGDVSTTVFEQGLALPSGSAMTDDDIDRVIGALDDALTDAHP
jgi:pyridoxal phosphate-dependent aminotransferase EpsN